MVAGCGTNNEGMPEVYEFGSATTTTSSSNTSCTKMIFSKNTDSVSFAGQANQTAINFQNKMWVIGGFKSNNDGTSKAYESTNGTDWTEHTINITQQRSGHSCVVFSDHMWIIGGRGNESTS